MEKAKNGSCSYGGTGLMGEPFCQTLIEVQKNKRKNYDNGRHWHVVSRCRVQYSDGVEVQVLKIWFAFEIQSIQKLHCNGIILIGYRKILTCKSARKFEKSRRRNKKSHGWLLNLRVQIKAIKDKSNQTQLRNVAYFYKTGAAACLVSSLNYMFMFYKFWFNTLLSLNSI